jgi:hypothetical protein
MLDCESEGHVARKSSRHKAAERARMGIGEVVDNHNETRRGRWSMTKTADNVDGIVVAEGRGRLAKSGVAILPGDLNLPLPRSDTAALPSSSAAADDLRLLHDPSALGRSHRPPPHPVPIRRWIRASPSSCLSREQIRLSVLCVSPSGLNRVAGMFWKRRAYSIAMRRRRVHWELSMLLVWEGRRRQ